MRLPVVISNIELMCDFYVLEKIQQTVIFGVDFMEKHKVEIDFGRKSVYIQERAIEVGLSACNSGIAKLAKYVRIPANSANGSIPVYVTRQKNGSTILLEPSANLNLKGLAGVEAVVKIKKSKAVINILNSSAFDVHLPPNYVVATAHEININVIQNLEDARVIEGTIPECCNIKIENINSGKEEAISFDLSNTELDDSQKARLLALLNNNREAFSTGLHDLGKTNRTKHTIETEPGAGPVKLPFYRQNPKITNNTSKNFGGLSICFVSC